MEDGTRRVVHVAAHNGWCSIKELTETGEPHYEHLPCSRLQRHKDKDGYRFYGYYKLPDEYGGKEISIRLHQNAEDDRRRINRTENLRPIPEGSPEFERLSRLRLDAESINRSIEDALWINRASAKGWRRQLIDLPRLRPASERRDGREVSGSRSRRRRVGLERSTPAPPEPGSRR
jgi:hypothetical protein